MNKSTNMESKEMEIEGDRENSRRRSEVRRERERLRTLANRRDRTGKGAEKKNPCCSTGFECLISHWLT